MSAALARIDASLILASAFLPQRVQLSEALRRLDQGVSASVFAPLVQACKIACPMAGGIVYGRFPTRQLIQRAAKGIGELPGSL